MRVRAALTLQLQFCLVLERCMLLSFIIYHINVLLSLKKILNFVKSRKFSDLYSKIYEKSLN